MEVMWRKSQAVVVVGGAENFHFTRQPSQVWRLNSSSFARKNLTCRWDLALSRGLPISHAISSLHTHIHPHLKAQILSF